MTQEFIRDILGCGATIHKAYIDGEFKSRKAYMRRLDEAAKQFAARLDAGLQCVGVHTARGYVPLPLSLKED